MYIVMQSFAAFLHLCSQHCHTSILSDAPPLSSFRCKCSSIHVQHEANIFLNLWVLFATIKPSAARETGTATRNECANERFVITKRVQDYFIVL